MALVKQDPTTTPIEAGKRWARLKQYAPKAGQQLQSYTAFGIKFEASKGWYIVSDKVAKYLETVHTVPDNPDTAFAFDVMSKDEADKLNAREFKSRVQSGRLDPNDAEVVNVDPRDVSDIGGVNVSGGGGDLSSADLAKATRSGGNSATAGPRASRGATGATGATGPSPEPLKPGEKSIGV